MCLLRAGRTLSLVVVVGMLCVGLGAVAAAAQKAATVPVVMLSDIHFDPFHDPAKFERLRAAPVAEWQGIFAEPDAPTQAADFGKLMEKCRVRGVDTPWTLLQSSLAAARAQSPHVLFVTVSGDLLVHSFDCRFRLLVPGATDVEYSAFAAKTAAYVASELHRTFAKTPVYLALGNNDSGCGDYHESGDSGFLHSVAESFGDDVESASEREEILRVFPAGGDYSVELPKPIVRGRLIILQDIFLSTGYAGCNGKPDAAAGAAELNWLRKELESAHAHHEQVWVMAHIPPGVNLYSTVSHNRDVCAGQAPEMFLRDEKMVEVLTDFAADIRLAIFAHTHSDEMRLLQAASPKVGSVAMKMVPSVTPINGNNPAFTVADIDPKTAVMKDYRVVAANNKTGIDAKWSEEYRYSTTYHRSSYTPQTLASLLVEFSADKGGTSPESTAYEQNFIVGGGLRAAAIRLVWPQYVCSMENNTEAGYRGCACPATP